MKTTRTMLPRVEELEARTLFSATLVKDINPIGSYGSSPFVSSSQSGSLQADVNGTLFFQAGDGTHGVELWKSDGTAAGTVLVKDITPGSASTTFSDPVNINGTLFFNVENGNYKGVWKSDGTEAGTVYFADNQLGESETVGGTTFFVSDGNRPNFFSGSSAGLELWKTDGTLAGTVLVKNINTTSSSANSTPERLTNVNGTLFFTADDGVHGRELWKSDGTEAGTVLVKDINTNTGNYGVPLSSNISGLSNVNGTLFFSANDGVHGQELWKSDGTEAGTVLVKDANPTATFGYGPGSLTNVNGTLFFATEDGIHGRELWKSDGTAAGTVMVKDIALNDNFPSYGPSGLTNLNGTLFFSAYNGTRFSLWKSDGTAAGTIRVKDIGFGNPMNVNGTLFFLANDGTHGTELWQSDGTAAGTALVKDITPGGSTYLAASPTNLINVNGTLFFKDNDGVHGSELWKATPGPVNDTTGPRVTAAVFSGTAAGTFDRVLLTFSEAIDASSFTTSDVTLNGPGGQITPSAVTPVTGSTTEFIVSFQAQSAQGIYTAVVGPNILDLAGNPMNQNGNATNGENPGDSFVGSGVLGTPTVPPFFAVGNVGGSVRIVNSTTGTVISTIRPLDAGSQQQYTGIVEVALGDFNGDGVPDLAVAAADPVGLHGLANNKAGKVFVYDGAALVTGLVPTSSFRSFTPFATTSGPAGTTGAYTNGLNIATGDVDGDGNVDLIAGTRGATAGVGLAEFGRLVVIDGTSPAGSNVIIGGIQTPFGPGYQKGVVVAAGNADGVGGDEIAVTRGGPVASTDPVIQQIKVKVLQLQGGSLTELHLNADGSTSFAPFGSLSGPASAIKRDGRVAFLDADGDGTDELVFTALDPLTNASNQQVRVGVYSINPAASSGAATIVSTGPDAGTYLTGTGVVDHAVTHVPGAGAVETIALLTESVSSGIAYLDPLTGTEQSGGFALSVLHGGITIDVN